MNGNIKAGLSHSMETASGGYVDLLNPHRSTIHLEDIAIQLARISRFNGATCRFYSVAEHALLVSEWVEVTTGDPRTSLVALHHDSHEAYIGDLTRPLKAALGPSQRLASIVHSLDFVIASALGLPVNFLPRVIKDADNWALSAEAFHLMPDQGRGWFSEGIYEPDDDGADWGWGRISSRDGMYPDEVAAEFVERHGLLAARVKELA